MFYNGANIAVGLSFDPKIILNPEKKETKNGMMSKKETNFIRFAVISLMSTILHADTDVALLQSVDSNAQIRLSYQNIPFVCKPAGIIPLETMAFNAPDPKECRNRVEAYYRSHPSDRSYGAQRLYDRQTYHFKMIKEGCVLYGNGPESYSEMLLSQGLALVDPLFDNPEWNARLRRAQKGAEIQKKGLHDSQIRVFCIKEEK